MKKLLIGFLCLTGIALASDSDYQPKSHGYATIGVELPFPMPKAGLGYRFISDEKGVDFSLDIASIYIGNIISSSVKYIEYFDRNYFAVGGTIAHGFAKYKKESVKGVAISPVITFGRDLDKTFHQFNVNFPCYSIDRGVFYIPTVSYQYGIKF